MKIVVAICMGVALLVVARFAMTRFIEFDGEVVSVIWTPAQQQKLIDHLLADTQKQSITLHWGEHEGAIDLDQVYELSDPERFVHDVRTRTFKNLDLTQYVVIDRIYLERTIMSLSHDWGLKSAQEAVVAIDEGRILSIPPQDGKEIDVEDTIRRITNTWLTGIVQDELHLFIEPKLKKAGMQKSTFERFVRGLEEVLEGDITLFIHKNGNDEQVVVTPQILGESLFLGGLDTDEPFVAVDSSILEVFPSYRESIARDATFERIGETGITVRSSTSGVQVDALASYISIRSALRKGERMAELKIFENDNPAFSTADAEALGIRRLIASFTTYHSCCEGRVENIHAMADIVNGTVLLPGEEFSLNDAVGKRTQENGFVPAGTILKGIFVDTVGGGVSQFATTIYNAAFWSGLELIEHAPHSRLFSRYPEGIEATVSWPSPNLRFKNDYTTPIVLLAWYTDTAISVGVYGDNDGRSTVGSHTSGNTETRVVSEGGPASRIVTAKRSDRYDEREFLIEYIADSTVPVGENRIIDNGAKGYKIDVERDVFVGDTSIHKDRWIVRYQPVTKVFGVRDCDILRQFGLHCQTNAEYNKEKEYLRKMFE